MKNSLLILILLYVGVFAQCTSKNTKKDSPNASITGEIANEAKDSGKENFNLFLKKFQQDSLFRIDRVVFPLKGYNSDEVEETGDEASNEVLKDYYWKKSDWIEYAKVDYSASEYKSKIEIANTLVKHTIYIENSGFKIYSEFKLITDVTRSLLLQASKSFCQVMKCSFCVARRL